MLSSKASLLGFWMVVFSLGLHKIIPLHVFVLFFSNTSHIGLRPTLETWFSYVKILFLNDHIHKYGGFGLQCVNFGRIQFSSSHCGNLNLASLSSTGTCLLLQFPDTTLLPSLWAFLPRRLCEDSSLRLECFSTLQSCFSQSCTQLQWYFLRVTLPDSKIMLQPYFCTFCTLLYNLAWLWLND